MFKIGAFSRLSQVPVATLRFYDAVGLLKPVQVDRFTGYRFYAADQLARLNRILALKDLGFSLEQIGWLLDEELPPDQLRGMLRLKRTEVQQRLEDEQARLGRVEARLRQIEWEVDMPTYDVTVKRVDPITVAVARAVVPAHRNAGWLFDEVRACLDQHGVTHGEYAIALWHERHPMFEVEAAIPLTSGEVDASWVNGRVTVAELPAVETMASVAHQGGPGTLGYAYESLQTWAGTRGYMLCGPYREIVVQAGASPEDETVVIELQIPITVDERLEPVRAILAPEELALLTERTKQALELAMDEARARGRTDLEPEDVLIGLIEAEQGFAGQVLKTFGVTPDEVRKVITAGPGSQPSEERIDRLRPLFAAALDEVRQCKHDYLGTEHLLLGLLRDGDGVAVHVLEHGGVTAEQVRKEVEQLLRPSE